MGEPEGYFVGDDGEVVGLDVVPVVRDDVEGPMIMTRPDGDAEIVTDWSTVRCGGCGDVAHIATPPPDRRPGPDGIYSGVCPRCAQGTPLEAPLNRAERRARRRDN